MRVPAGVSVRPSTDRMREAVFSSLGTRIVGETFIDLFAGSGSYGLESLSRGAIGGTFVEKNAKTAAMLRENLKNVCQSAAADPKLFSVVISDALKFTTTTPVGIIFADPPYSLYPGILNDILNQANRILRLSAESRLVLELPGGISLDGIPDWQCEKRFGKGGRNDPTVAILSTHSH